MADAPLPSSTDRAAKWAVVVQSFEYFAATDTIGYLRPMVSLVKQLAKSPIAPYLRPTTSLQSLCLTTWRIDHLEPPFVALEPLTDGQYACKFVHQSDASRPEVRAEITVEYSEVLDTILHLCQPLLDRQEKGLN
jgi:hypothetical protein